jgi:hypothetical protein
MNTAQRIADQATDSAEALELAIDAPATYSIWNSCGKPVSADISAHVSSSEVDAKAQRIANRTKQTVYVVSPEGSERKVCPLDPNGVPLAARLHRAFLVARRTMRGGEPWSETFFTRDKEQALTLASQWRREGHRVQFRPLAFSADGSRLRMPVYSASATNDIGGGSCWFGYRPVRSRRCRSFGVLPMATVNSKGMASGYLV